MQRVNVGDPHGVGDQRPGGRSSPWADRDVALFGVADEIPDNQEISRELHLLDDADLAFQALFVLGQRVFEFALIAPAAQRFHSAGKPFARNVGKITVERVALRHVKMGKGIGHLLQTQAATLRDVQGAGQDLRTVFKHTQHLVVGLYIELVPLKLHPGGVVDGLAGLDAEHHVLGVGIVFAEIVAVIGGDEGEPQVFFQLKQAGMNAVLHRKSLVLDFEKEIVLAKDVAVIGRSRARGCVVPFRQALGDFALEAGGEADQSSRMLRQKLLTDSGFVVEAVQRGL